MDKVELDGYWRCRGEANPFRPQDTYADPKHIHDWRIQSEVLDVGCAKPRQLVKSRRPVRKATAIHGDLSECSGAHCRHHEHAKGLAGVQWDKLPSSDYLFAVDWEKPTPAPEPPEATPETVLENTKYIAAVELRAAWAYEQGRCLWSGMGTDAHAADLTEARRQVEYAAKRVQWHLDRLAPWIHGCYGNRDCPPWPDEPADVEDWDEPQDWAAAGWKVV